MYMNQAPKQRTPKTPKKGGFGKTALKTVAVALIFGLVGGTAFEGVHLGASRLTASTTESATVATVAEKSDNVKTASGSSDSSSSSTLDYDVSILLSLLSLLLYPLLPRSQRIISTSSRTTNRNLLVQVLVLSLERQMMSYILPQTTM